MVRLEGVGKERGRQVLHRSVMEHLVGCTARAAEETANAEARYAVALRGVEVLRRDHGRRVERVLALARATSELRGGFPAVH